MDTQTDTKNYTYRKMDSRKTGSKAGSKAGRQADRPGRQSGGQAGRQSVSQAGSGLAGRQEGHSARTEATSPPLLLSPTPSACKKGDVHEESKTTTRSGRRVAKCQSNRQ